MQIQLLAYRQLNTDQLYQILKLRQDVFIREQNSIYPDLDGLDQQAEHLLLTDGETLAGYARLRLLPQKNLAKIERVVLAPDYRGRKLADGMMDTLVAAIENADAIEKATLSAQLGLVAFYQRWGFSPVGEPYDDAGVMHQDMVCELG